MLIDLDVVPAPAPPRQRRERRWWGFAAVAVVVLLVLGGAAAPSRPVVFPRVTGTGDRQVTSTLLTTDTLYSVHDDTGEDSTAIVARPLLAGGPAWEARIPMMSADSVRLTRMGSVLVVQDDTTVKILDGVTGKDRWDAVGETPLAVGNGTLLLRSEGAEVHLVDAETGRARWRQQVDSVDGSLDPAGRYVFLVDYAFSMQVRSAVDGRLLASRDIGQPDAAAPVIIDDRAYLLGASTVTAVNLPGLTPAWTGKPLVLIPRQVMTCGELLCVRGDSGVSALDPATGELRWTAPDGLGWSGGVFLRTDGRNALVDPATGRVVRDLGRGRAAGDLMLRADGDRTQVTDLRTGRLYGPLPSGVAPFGCVAAGEFLACGEHGGTTVWRIVRTTS